MVSATDTMEATTDTLDPTTDTVTDMVTDMVAPSAMMFRDRRVIPDRTLDTMMCMADTDILTTDIIPAMVDTATDTTTTNLIRYEAMNCSVDL